MGLFGRRYRMDHERFKRYRRFPTYQGPESIAPKHPIQDGPRIDPDAHLPEPPNSADKGIYDRWHARYETQEGHEEPEHWFEDPPVSRHEPPRNSPRRSKREVQPDLGELGYVPLIQDIRDLITPVIPEVPRVWGPETQEETPEAHRIWLEEKLEEIHHQSDGIDPDAFAEIMEAVMEQRDEQLEPLEDAGGIGDGQGSLETTMTDSITTAPDALSDMHAAHDQQMEMSLEERVSQEEMLEQQGMEALPEDPLEAQERMYDEMQQMMDPMMPGPYGPGPGPGFGPMPGP